MSHIRCEVCRFLKRDTEAICPQCADTGRRQLRDFPALHQASKNQQRRKGTQGAYSRSRSGSSIPGDLNALDFSQAQDLVDILLDWKKDIWERENLEETLGKFHRPLATPSNALANLVNFILAHFQTLMKDPEPAQIFLAEIGEIYRTGLRATGQIEPKQSRMKCPNTFRGKPCNAWLEVDKSDMQAEISCPRCKVIWPVSWLFRVVLSTPNFEYWESIPNIAQLKGITSRKARYWIKKWHIPKFHTGAYYDLKRFIDRYDKEFPANNSTESEK